MKRVVLAFLRISVAVLLVVLMINPLVKTEDVVVDKPVVAILNDVSRSLSLGRDSAFYKNALPLKTDSVVSALKEKCDVEVIDFGGETTNITSALSDVTRRYYGQNLAAVVLLSDGLYNAGGSPEAVTATLPCHLYTVTVGDTARHRTVWVKNAICNEKVPKGSDFVVRVTVNATNCADEQLFTIVSVDGAVVKSKNVKVGSNDFSKTLDFDLSADEEGVHEIKIAVSSSDESGDKVKSEKNIFVEVVDRQYDAVVVERAPHPDVAALRRASEGVCQFVAYTDLDCLDTLRHCDLIVFHDIPSTNGDVGEIDKITAFLDARPELPVMFIVGANTDVDAFNRLINKSLSGVFDVKRGAVSTPLSVTPVFNESFGLFTMPSEARAWFGKCPPLSVPHIDFTSRSAQQTVAFMSISGVPTETPLFAFFGKPRHTAVIFGTGFWQWALREAYGDGTHEIFDDIFRKAVSYLATKDKNDVTLSYRDAYSVGEDVVMDAALMNPAGEPTTEPELNLEVSGRRRVFSADDEGYHINLGRLGEGVYPFVVSATYKGVSYRRQGVFVVTDAGIEAERLTADYGLMRRLASSAGGRHVFQNEICELTDVLSGDEKITPVRRIETKFTDIVSVKSLFLVILLLITADWLVRKIF